MNKRPYYNLLLIMLCCVMVIIPAVQNQAQAQNNSTIRVYLRRLKVEDSIHIEFDGSYMLEGGMMTFAKGSQIDVTLRNQQLILHHQGLAVVMGDRMKLMRCEQEAPSSLRINSESGAYEGDLALDIVDGCIRPILSIHIEDYLLGVVPFEMGDSFPLEALKAQAIAARTYALNKQGSDHEYDVEDTTNDQAYRGRTLNSPLSEQAVVETAGLVGTYQGRLAQCYYSASNGGQTELGQHVWPVDDPSIYGYMDMRDDPYDLNNEASSVKRYTIKKKPGKSGVGAALHTELVLGLSEQLEALGFSAEDDLVRIDEVVSLSLGTPRFELPSRLMTEMTFMLKLSVRECTYRDLRPTPVLAPVNDAEQSASPSPTHVSLPTATPAYTPYTALKQIFTVTLPIFTAAEKAMGLSINVYQNEMLSVMDIGSAYAIESRRFGHGVGMSQRGAQEMAKNHGKTHEEILAFYYPGLELKSYPMIREPLPTIDTILMATPAPTASPTPRPTLMPVTQANIPSGAYLAEVTNIEADSSLNLREGPSLSAEIKRRLYKEQQLIVLSVSRDGWAHVKTDVIEGYVKAEYLQTIQKK